jgi:NADPH-dependent glutamate synthase beta subunit-like oxidoreductase/Pyruvate/2-oxoacid:ferredoxin oxidoreductase delta subunit
LSDGNREGGGPDPAPGRLTPSFRPVQREKAAPCQVGCATSGDVRGWIGIIARREEMGLSLDDAYSQAWRMITEVNPFPSVMGRVCPHPCEGHCNRAALDEPLAINAMERFLGDRALAEALPLERRQTDSRDEWIGVVGAGPSGLSFAYQMVRRGYRVTVYEGREKPGGMLRYGIPDYRLPPEVLDAEVARILDLGVELKLDTLIGRDVTLDGLRERHHALYLGIGAQRGRGLGIPGEDGPGMWTGTEYLNRVNKGEAVAVGSRVAVIGGGNTAVDAARAARRSGAKVTLLYRRSREEMPAIPHEIDDALEEGVDLVLLSSPVRLVREDGQPGTLVARRMRLGEPDASGRRRPVPVSGSEFDVPVDSVIAAVSQEPDLVGLEAFAGNGGWLLTNESGSVEEGVWAGGDALGLGIAGVAIAQGRRAAEALHARLSGTPEVRDGMDGGSEIGPERINLDYHEERPSAKPHRLAPSERLSDPSAEVSGVITERQFLEEADRCFSCGSCFGCQQCSMYCTSGCYIKLEEAESGVYFALSLDQCEECGKCIEVCPCGFLDVSDG